MNAGGIKGVFLFLMFSILDVISLDVSFLVISKLYGNYFIL